MYIAVIHGLPYARKDRPSNAEKMQRHEIALRTWEHEHLFDAESHYRCFADNAPTVSTFERILANTIYNPVVKLHTEWRRVGDFELTELVSVVAKGLEKDDDIIQQWFDGSDVLKLLRSAGNWNEILLAVDAIGGGHEDTPSVARYVDRVLAIAG